MAKQKASINFAQLTKILKGGETKHSKVAERLGLAPSQLDMTTFCKAKVAAGLAKKIPATSKSVRAARDQQKLRWEDIAARTNLTVGKVKALYEEGGGTVSNSYTGRGRNWNGEGGTTKRSSAKRTSAKRSSAKRSPAKRSAAKRSSAKRTPAKRAAATPTRARTRAQRLARSKGNPS